MTFREYYGLPEGTNATLTYASFYSTLGKDFPCPPNMDYAFGNENRRIILQRLDMSQVNSMNHMLDSCNSLNYIEGIEDWDVSNVTNMEYMFGSCKNLTSLDLSNWDTSKVTKMEYMFYFCNKLTSIKLNGDTTVNVTNMNGIFSGCDALESISALRADNVVFPSYNGPFGDMKKLVNFGGFIGLKSSIIAANYAFNKAPNLSYESCINVLNGLYDFVGNGETPSSSQGKLKVHQNFLNLVGNEISIATNKGWTITV